jgi:molybdopterin-guanine dinucleotide biosynthesis protein A
MGTDKALLTFAGQPLITRALAILQEAALSPSIAGAHAQLAGFAPVIEDPASDSGLGPLAGICAALGSTSAEYAVFLPVDLPLLPSSLVSYLLSHARITGAIVTVPSINGFAQTFPVVVHRSALPELTSRLHSGERGCFAAFKAAAANSTKPFSILSVELLVQAGQIDHPAGLSPALWLANVNTPADLARAESFLSRPLRVI